MGTCAEAIFNCPNKAFDFDNVGVGGHHVYACSVNNVSNALNFLVTVVVTRGKTAGSVELDDSVDLLENGLAPQVWDRRCNGAEADVAGDGAQETDALDREKINAEGDITVVSKDRSREWHGGECRCTGWCSGPCHLTLDGCSGGPVYNQCANGIVGRDGAVQNKVFILGMDIHEKGEGQIHCNGAHFAKVGQRQNISD